ncbi:MAG: division plane positioning ATPase MipZ [Rhodospirillaceae bacterium]
MTAKIVVFGNEKGGTGKSTLAMHLIVALLQRGLSVGTLDLDARQGTLSRYIANRRRTAERDKVVAIPLPMHIAIPPSTKEQPRSEEGDDLDVAKALEQLAGNDVIVIDTPGHDSSLSQVGHAYADILVTPINDSLVDFDVLAAVDPERLTVARPSHYSERVWKAKQLRAKRDGGSIDWVVVRNRLGQLDARNKRQVGKLLEELAKRIGFRLADGIYERVIFRELFLEGLTAEDLAVLSHKRTAAVSHVAARQEVRALMTALGLDALATSSLGRRGRA